MQAYYEIFNFEHFSRQTKITLRPSRKHCSLLCVFVMKEYLLNRSSIRLITICWFSHPDFCFQN
eukprot:UN21335